MKQTAEAENLQPDRQSDFTTHAYICSAVLECIIREQIDYQQKWDTTGAGASERKCKTKSELRKLNFEQLNVRTA